MQHYIYDLFFRNEKSNWLIYLTHGLLIILFGLTILFYPEILVAFIATIFFIIGLLVIAFAFHIKKSNHKFQNIRININD